jgi:hypothetical protein
LPLRQSVVPRWSGIWCAVCCVAANLAAKQFWHPGDTGSQPLTGPHTASHQFPPRLTAIGSGRPRLRGGTVARLLLLESLFDVRNGLSPRLQQLLYQNHRCFVKFTGKFFEISR